MSLVYLQNRRKIEGIYKQLEIVRNKMRSLMIFGREQFTSGNIELLEIEETKLINKLLRLKSLI